jgi:hypothetical protein
VLFAFRCSFFFGVRNWFLTTTDRKWIRLGIAMTYSAEIDGPSHANAATAIVTVMIMMIVFTAFASAAAAASTGRTFARTTRTTGGFCRDAGS